MDRDQELMVRTAKGDSIAFEALFRKWERPVYAFLCRALGSGEAAEDCLQETFVKLWRSAPRYRPSYKVSTYLFRIATNAMIDQRRREGRHSRVAAPLSDCDGSTSIDSLPSEASDPIDRAGGEGGGRAVARRHCGASARSAHRLRAFPLLRTYLCRGSRDYPRQSRHGGLSEICSSQNAPEKAVPLSWRVEK